MARSRWNLRKLHSFAALEGGRRALLVEAALALLLVRVALLAIPFPWLARRMGSLVPPSDHRAAQGRSGSRPDHVRLAREIRWAVTRAARHVPFRAVCLPQAMAAQLMLKRRGVRSVLHFGVAKGAQKPLDAHAWLDAAGVEVTGFPVGRDLAEIACLV